MLHRLVAQTTERLYAERISEHLNALYHHFRLAEEWGKVVSYGQALAEKTQRLSQFQEAVTILDDTTDALLRIPMSKSRQMTLVDILLQKNGCSTRWAPENARRLSSNMPFPFSRTMRMQQDSLPFNCDKEIC